MFKSAMNILIHIVIGGLFIVITGYFFNDNSVGLKLKNLVFELVGHNRTFMLVLIVVVLGPIYVIIAKYVCKLFKI